MSEDELVIVNKDMPEELLEELKALASKHPGDSAFEVFDRFGLLKRYPSFDSYASEGEKFVSFRSEDILRGGVGRRGLFAKANTVNFLSPLDALSLEAHAMPIFDSNSFDFSKFYSRIVYRFSSRSPSLIPKKEIAIFSNTRFRRDGLSFSVDHTHKGVEFTKSGGSIWSLYLKEDYRSLPCRPAKPHPTSLALLAQIVLPNSPLPHLEAKAKIDASGSPSGKISLSGDSFSYAPSSPFYTRLHRAVALSLPGRLKPGRNRLFYALSPLQDRVSAVANLEAEAGVHWGRSRAFGGSLFAFGLAYSAMGEQLEGHVAAGVGARLSLFRKAHLEALVQPVMNETGSYPLLFKIRFDE